MRPSARKGDQPRLSFPRTLPVALHHDPLAERPRDGVCAFKTDMLWCCSGAALVLHSTVAERRSCSRPVCNVVVEHVIRVVSPVWDRSSKKTARALTTKLIGHKLIKRCALHVIECTNVCEASHAGPCGP